ncbi:putative E3 ubiquitin-protein ligase [Blastocystis sp. subtype 4]|uniref:putative E3 ubiquitin-protein ligase n=1 Tax=Blastocystis sp. subtype 4 TaxID=944170 RepID=UPI00071202D6|nr:putative E3 ubiquitin-protein ligase [Blastocystis sp. subtype 4]KNB42540.1 putative E3 ubiquitin-protein ligase [Blastocystis sp. subtype 4]|eukprot:XP_014525983.1 putative E3 ubiquitin-protein ligase [Blastocystis sp. subtype 4]
MSRTLSKFDSSIAPYTPKTLYKVECPVFIRRKTICIKESKDHPNQYAIAFEGTCKRPCDIRVYTFAREIVGENEYTTGISLLPCVDREQREDPPLIHMDISDSFVFDGWKYNCGILNKEQIQQQKVDLTHSWSVIIRNRTEAHIKLITQKGLIQNRGYFISDMYGLDEMTNGSEEEKECVVCMTNKRDTCVLPCRHVCCCADCANTLRLQSDKCPVCRKPMTELVYLSVNPQYLNGEVDKEGKTNIEMQSMYLCLLYEVYI